jgi:hypothetical protein
MPSTAGGLHYEVYLITTKEAVVRQEKCLKFLKQIPSLSQITVINSERDVEDTRRGCFNAHKQWAKTVAESENIDAAVVFEDDIYSDLSPEDLNTKVLESLTFIKYKEPKPDIFFLGHLPCGRLSRTTAGGAFVKSNWSQLTHAIIVPRAFAIELATWEYRPGDHIDQRISATSTEQYAIYPQIMFQNDTITFHSRWVDKILTKCRDVIGPMRLCKWLEWFWIKI